MAYAKDIDNPVFLVPLVDQYGAPVTGVTTPTVYLSVNQGDNTTIDVWTEDTDFEWFELTDGEKLKGWYKLRQMTNPTQSAVAVNGECALHVYKTDVDTASGGVVYHVGPDAVWDALRTDHILSGSFGQGFRRLLQPGRVEIVSAVDTDGAITIVQGDDYNDTDGTVLEWTSTDYSGPDVTSAVVVFTALPTEDYEDDTTPTLGTLSVVGSVAMDGNDAVWKVALTAVETAALGGAPPAKKWNYSYQLKTTFTSDRVITQEVGTMTVVAKVAP